MEYLYLALVTIMLAGQSVVQKEYNRKTKNSSYLYTLIAAVSATVVFLIIALINYLTSGIGLKFTLEVGIYSLLFALGYCLAMITYFLAIKTGPMSISALILQYSLILPAIYGIFALNEPIKVTLFIGLGLLVISLLLVNLKKGEKGVKPTLKWAIFVILLFISNGFCAIVQKVQQVNFSGQFKSEFMIMGLLISSVVLLALTLTSERKLMLDNLKKGGLFGCCGGVFNAGINFLFMVLAVMPASVVYPILSAGGTLITAVVAYFVYKEKLSPMQLVGLGVGIASIVLLNI